MGLRVLQDIRGRGFRLAAWAVAVMVAGLLSASAVAEPDGRTEAVKPPSTEHPYPELWSGSHFAAESTQEMQDDDVGNPAMPWYDIGEELWSKREGEANKSCQDCHGDAAKSMKNVGATYPIYYAPWKKLINVENRINLCREKFMKAPPWKYDSDDMLAMMIYVKNQSSGVPVNVNIEGPAKPFFEKGKAFYEQRRGQLDFACSNCHTKYWGQKIRMDTLSQGQSNGFPTYRLKWQKPGSLHRRFKACNTLVRSTPFKAGSDEYVNLELYLAWRGQGLPVETPSVRH